MINLSDDQNRSDAMTSWLSMIERLRSTLARPGEPAVEMIQTHISAVLLGKRIALKLKKPVDFGFLDYTTLEKRRVACYAEVDLNSRLSPDVYLGVQPVVERDGVLHLHGRGRIVDYAVVMKRLPDAGMLDRMVTNNSVTEAIIGRIAERLSQFHRKARRSTDVDKFGSIEVLGSNWRENFDQTMPFVGRTIDSQDFESIRLWVNTWLAEHEDLLKSRVANGFICDGHGDVRCESICVESDAPDGISIFDCIEFNDRFRCGDVAGEVAFLATDLDARGRPDLGYFFTQEYSSRAVDEQIFSLLPFYRCYRAFVRGKVLSFRLDEPEFTAREHADAASRARHFFDLAIRYATPLSTPTIVAVSGFSGTGKTAVARAIAGELGWRVVSSDAMRALIFGEAKQPTAYGQAAYSDNATRHTYERLLETGHEWLCANSGVVLDATFLRAEQRAAVEELARASGAACHFIECSAPPEIIRARLARRIAHRDGDSDADWDVYLRQREQYNSLPEPVDASRLMLDTSQPLSNVAQVATTWLRARELSEKKGADPTFNPPFRGCTFSPGLSQSDLVQRS